MWGTSRKVLDFNVLPLQGAYRGNAVFTQGVAHIVRLPWARLCCTFSAKNEIVLRAIVINALQISVITL